MKSKVVASALEAVSDVRPGMSVMLGGFAPTMSLPTTLMNALVHHGAGDLTVISCSIGYGRYAPQMLAEAGLVKRYIGSAASQVARPTPFEDRILAGEIEVEIVPRGPSRSASAPPGPAFRPSTRPRRPIPISPLTAARSGSSAAAPISWRRPSPPISRCSGPTPWTKSATATLRAPPITSRP